jgi:hypothetical protein
MFGNAIGSACGFDSRQLHRAPDPAKALRT